MTAIIVLAVVIFIATRSPRGNRYGIFNFLFDIFMIIVTVGFWCIWIFVREMRRSQL